MVSDVSTIISVATSPASLRASSLDRFTKVTLTREALFSLRQASCSGIMTCLGTNDSLMPSSSEAKRHCCACHRDSLSRLTLGTTRNACWNMRHFKEFSKMTTSFVPSLHSRPRNCRMRRSTTYRLSPFNSRNECTLNMSRDGGVGSGSVVASPGPAHTSSMTRFERDVIASRRSGIISGISPRSSPAQAYAIAPMRSVGLLSVSGSGSPSGRGGGSNSPS
mmetsp:Transcript_90306/g.233101  ORF Transcript_90306/g.233101 Transcript_90306/m.233101 type:complete len:221 (+) Transcript_90306:442-1104(+)